MEFLHQLQATLIGFRLELLAVIVGVILFALVFALRRRSSSSRVDVGFVSRRWIIEHRARRPYERA